MIKDFHCRYYRVPLARVLVDALHGDHSHFELVVVEIVLNDGARGVGYTYTGGKGGRAIFAMLQYDLRSILLGRDSDRIEQLWQDMQTHVHYVGRGGVEAFAISAVDIALWDLRAKKAGLPLWKLLGGACSRVKAYAGAIDLNFSLEELVENNLSYLRRGFQAVKIKLGKPSVAEDLERVAKVREAIGPDTTLMVDANTSWTVPQAVKSERLLRNYDVFWIEEPIGPDDVEGYAKIAAKTEIPLAAGENFHSVYAFQQMIQYGKIDFPQPDVSNIGGISGWLKVANLAYVHQLTVSSHGMQEMHVSLLGAMSHAGYLEVHSFPIDEYTRAPLAMKDGYAVVPDGPGHGVDFLWDKLSPYQEG